MVEMRSLKKTLQWAERKKIALGHFNVSSYEQFKAVASVARKLNVPVLIGVSEGERDFWGEEEIKGLVDIFNKKYGSKSSDGSCWIFLNADHTRSMSKIKKAASLGFDEVIFDGSDKSLEKNILLTKKAVAEVKSVRGDILVEGEVGYIGQSSEIWDRIPAGVSLQNLTTPEEAKKFVEETKVDLFAPAVGNIHGISIKGKNPPLDIKRIKAIKRAVKVPLVLHGGSGISNSDLLLAIKAGVNLIHISTELRLAWRKGWEESFKKNKEELAPYELAKLSTCLVEKAIKRKIKLFYRF